ncbi:MAG: hypothetical protein QOG88_827 [Actinomycetota bacterium]|nr:hypothetical protein [Actinomycetota bacterium]
MLVALLIAIPVLIAIALLSIAPALGSREHFQKGKDELTQAQSALFNGDIETANRAFQGARFEFEQAAGAGNNPFVRITSWLPIVGRTPDALRTLADVGLRLTAAGQGVSTAIGNLPGGYQALSLRGGTIPVEALSSLGPAIHEARAQIDDASAEAAGIATTLVPSAVVEAGDQVRAKLAQATPVATAGDEMIRQLPAFAGMSAPARYFLAPQNPTELRGTGGFVSRWSILTIDHGKISVAPFRSISKLRNVANPTWPNPDLKEIYGPYNSAGFWRSTNDPRDGPTAAALMTNLWDQTQATPIDGVVMVDVQALRFMVGAIGKVNVQFAGKPVVLTENNVAPFLANDAYSLFRDQRARKDAVGAVGQKIFEEFLARASGDQALRALISATGDGHILVNATDPALENALTQAGATGSLGPGEAGGDFFATSVVNQGGNKLDFYIHRDVRYDVTLLPDGNAQVDATVTFKNTAPAGAPPSYVLGPFEGKSMAVFHLRVGEAYQATSFYCASGCVATSIQHDGSVFPAAQHTEQGLTLYNGQLRIPAQTTAAVHLTMNVPGVWTGDAGQGTYTLTLQDQPTIVPTSASVVVHTPEGAVIAYASDGMKVSGSTATWTGKIGPRSVIQVRFQKGLWTRAWSGLHDFLSKPVITFGN